MSGKKKGNTAAKKAPKAAAKKVSKTKQKAAKANKGNGNGISVAAKKPSSTISPPKPSQDNDDDDKSDNDSNDDTDEDNDSSGSDDEGGGNNNNNKKKKKEMKMEHQPPLPRSSERKGPLQLSNVARSTTHIYPFGFVWLLSMNGTNQSLSGFDMYVPINDTNDITNAHNNGRKNEIYSVVQMEGDGVISCHVPMMDPISGHQWLAVVVTEAGTISTQTETHHWIYRLEQLPSSSPTNEATPPTGGLAGEWSLKQLGSIILTPMILTPIGIASSQLMIFGERVMGSTSHHRFYSFHAATGSLVSRWSIDNGNDGMLSRMLPWHHDWLLILPGVPPKVKPGALAEDSNDRPCWLCNASSLPTQANTKAAIPSTVAQPITSIYKVYGCPFWQSDLRFVFVPSSSLTSPSTLSGATPDSNNGVSDYIMTCSKSGIANIWFAPMSPTSELLSSVSKNKQEYKGKSNDDGDSTPILYWYMLYLHTIPKVYQTTEFIWPPLLDGRRLVRDEAPRRDKEGPLSVAPIAMNQNANGYGSCYRLCHPLIPPSHGGTIEEWCGNPLTFTSRFLPLDKNGASHEPIMNQTKGEALLTHSFSWLALPQLPNDTVSMMISAIVYRSSDQLQVYRWHAPPSPTPSSRGARAESVVTRCMDRLAIDLPDIPPLSASELKEPQAALKKQFRQWRVCHMAFANRGHGIKSDAGTVGREILIYISPRDDLHMTAKHLFVIDLSTFTVRSSWSLGTPLASFPFSIYQPPSSLVRNKFIEWVSHHTSLMVPTGVAAIIIDYANI
jgi:hypothetical protein